MAETTYILNRPNFLASEVGLRTVTCTFAKSTAGAVMENGRKILKAGMVYPLNDATAKGIIFQDVDVTDGDRPGSLMVAGHYYDDKLVAPTNVNAKPVFQAQGLFMDAKAPTVTVPLDGTYE